MRILTQQEILGFLDQILACEFYLEQLPTNEIHQRLQVHENTLTLNALKESFTVFQEILVSKNNLSSMFLILGQLPGVVVQAI